MAGSCPPGCEVFASYLADFQQLSAGLSGKLAGPGTPGTDPWRANLRAIERELSEADEIVSQMENEIHSVPSSARPQLFENFRVAKKQIQDFRREFTKISAAPLARQALLGPAGTPGQFSGSNDKSADAADLTTEDILARTGDRIANAHRIAIESETSGIQTLTTLRSQREQLERTRLRVREVDSNVDRAQQVLRNMTRKLASNKIVTAAIIAMLVLLIIMIIFLKLS